MNSISAINSLACGPVADDPFAMLLLIVVVVFIAFVSLIGSVFGG